MRRLGDVEMRKRLRGLYQRSLAHASSASSDARRSVAQPLGQGLSSGTTVASPSHPSTNRTTVEVHADPVPDGRARRALGDEIVEGTIDRRDLGDDANSALGAHCYSDSSRRRSSTREVCSQVNPWSLRPKWP